MAASQPSLPNVHVLDWNAISHSILSHGWAMVPRLIQKSECQALVNLYDQDFRFRSRIDMERFNFGQGEYSYFCQSIAKNGQSPPHSSLSAPHSSC